MKRKAKMRRVVGTTENNNNNNEVDFAVSLHMYISFWSIHGCNDPKLSICHTTELLVTQTFDLDLDPCRFI